ncbi:MAG: hypothetical protein KatS3mg061_2890 [Dehalococcoidia bacterium]|nr:MAG: hypothetical protein KatS3mg061_2890 [Dehalococcoidia bacterium]
MARLLVTGGAGFIGSHIVAAALAAGHHVRVLDDLSTGSLANLAPWRDQIELLVGDVADPALAARAVAGMDWVSHQAARISVAESLAQPARYARVKHAGNGCAAGGRARGWGPAVRFRVNGSGLR